GFVFASAAPSGGTNYFTNNNISYNYILNGAYSGASQFVTAGPGTWVVGNNLFSFNNFNYNGVPGIGAPVFTVPYLPGIATDGGGNICAHPNPAGYPLVCN